MCGGEGGDGATCGGAVQVSRLPGGGCKGKVPHQLSCQAARAPSGCKVSHNCAVCVCVCVCFDVCCVCVLMLVVCVCVDARFLTTVLCFIC